MEVVAVIIALGVMYFTYRLIFGCWEELSDAVTYWFTPDIFSWIRGESMEDFFAEMKLGFWFLTGAATYFGVMNIFS
ncbi:MAG: hypothetical protein NE327_21960 [Lentisphaeraceae bacterium]|nr:hypothetical protein [Lentisphaeraceae bacterium]